MVIKKKSGTFDVYTCELSFKELQAFQAAGRESGDPVADEASKAIEWYFANEVPPPGVDEHPSKAAKEKSDEADKLLASGEIPEGPANEVPEGGVPEAPEAPEAAPSAPEGVEPAGGEAADGEGNVEDEAEKILPRE